MGSICFPALGFLNSQLISLGSPDELPLGRLLHARPVDLANENRVLGLLTNEGRALPGL